MSKFKRIPNSKCNKYIHAFFLKSYPYMGAIISGLKIWMIFYKLVPINFLDAKKQHRKRPNRIFSFLRLHRKVIIIDFEFFLFKDGPS